MQFIAREHASDHFGEARLGDMNLRMCRKDLAGSSMGVERHPALARCRKEKRGVGEDDFPIERRGTLHT